MASNSSNENLLNVNSASLANELLRNLRQESWPFLINDLPKGSFLVGGAIRDALLKKLHERVDLDIVVPDNAIKIANEIAQKISAKCITLDADRGMAKLITTNWNIDFASQMGGSIEEDLQRRDFRINAIAIALDDPPTLIDPIGGIKDIYNKKIVAIKEENLAEDPLRMLRAYRLSAEHNLVLDSCTINYISSHYNLLKDVSPERIQSEILKIVKVNSIGDILYNLEESKMLDSWIKLGCDKESKIKFSKYEKILNSNDLTYILSLNRLAKFLTDYGLKQLRFSKKYIQTCFLLRRWQDRNDGLAYQSLNEVERLQLHNDLEECLPALIVDLPERDQDIWISRWMDSEDPLFHPSSPLDGNTLQELLGLSAGVPLGKLISYLSRERAFGRLRDRNHAIEVARHWCKQNRPCCD